MFASLLYIMVQYMKEYIAYVVSTGSCLASLDVGYSYRVTTKIYCFHKNDYYDQVWCKG